jgi:hypothetical protein
VNPDDPSDALNLFGNVGYHLYGRNFPCGDPSGIFPIKTDSKGNIIQVSLHCLVFSTDPEGRARKSENSWD